MDLQYNLAGIDVHKRMLAVVVKTLEILSCSSNVGGSVQR
jgi:hypothetical protein